MTRSLNEIRNDAQKLGILIVDAQTTSERAAKVLCAYVEELATHIEELNAKQDDMFRRLRQEIVNAKSAVITEAVKAAKEKVTEVGTHLGAPG